jgi:P4 family phage/plasmid primase-like protien
MTTHNASAASAIDFLKANNRPDVALTHVALHPRGRYSIARSLEPDFLDAYVADMLAGKPLGIAEMPDHVMPLVVDVDLSSDVEQKLYDDEMILRTIELYTGAVRDRLLSPEFAGMWDVLLLEKPGYWSPDRTVYKNGFHVHFLNMYLTKTALLEVHAAVKTAMPQVDAGIPRNAWLMYGSSKAPDAQSYRATRLYRGSNPPTLAPQHEIPDECVLPALMSMHKNVNEVRLRTAPRPRELFKYGGGMSLAPVRGGISAAGSGRGGCTSGPVELDEVREMVSFLADERAVSYMTWSQIGWILYNVTGGTPAGFEIFDEFSRRGGRAYNSQAAANLWTAAQPRQITIRSLAYYARLDSPEFAARERAKSRKGRDIMSMFTNTELSHLLFDEYKSTYVCASVGLRKWYKFVDGIWSLNEDGVGLRMDMTPFICGLLDQHQETAMRALNAEIAELEASGGCDELQLSCAKSKRTKLAKDAGHNRALMNTSAFKHAVQRECLDVFYLEHFEQLLDANPYLIAFSNGVYDLIADDFRPGIPEDYMSKHMSIPYDASLTENSPSVVAVRRFLEQIFPNTNIRTYFLDQYCDIFVGGNMHKNVIIWTGDGDNGKSIVQTKFEKMLGPYAIKLPTTLITGKRTQSSSATPDLVRTGGGVRFVMMQEPDKSEQINSGLLKELSGNDTFYARGLYKEGYDLTPMFKIALICNDTPKITNGDMALWRRVKLLPFESKFVDHADPDYLEQLRTKTFQKDKNFAAKLGDMVPAFAWVLLQHRRQRTSDIIHEPDEVTAATEAYKNRNDVYAQFVAECVVDRQDASVHLTTLYESFRDWFKTSVGSAVPTKLEAREAFVKVLGQPVNHKWEGKLLQIAGEDMDADALDNPDE